MKPLFPDLPTEFETERLLLRSYRAGDGAMYFQMLRANWDHLYEFMPENVLALQNEDEAEEWICHLAEDYRQRNMFLFSLWEKATGDYVGEAYLANADWHVPCIELGYFLVKACTGKGFASEAAYSTTRFAFEYLGVSRVELQAAADNFASIRVAERCGFQYEGRLRQRTARKDGSRVDRLWYGMLRSEWQSSRADPSLR